MTDFNSHKTATDFIKGGKFETRYPDECDGIHFWSYRQQLRELCGSYDAGVHGNAYAFVDGSILYYGYSVKKAYKNIAEFYQDVEEKSYVLDCYNKATSTFGLINHINHERFVGICKADGKAYDFYILNVNNYRPAYTLQEENECRWHALKYIESCGGTERDNVLTPFVITEELVEDEADYILETEEWENYDE